MGTESQSRCRSRSTNRPHGGRTLPFFVSQETFRTVIWLRLILCGCWHLSLSKFFPSIAIADRSYLSGNLAGENVVVSMTELATHRPYNFPRELPEIRIPTWYGRIISKKAKIRIGYGRSVPCGMSAHTAVAVQVVAGRWVGVRQTMTKLTPPFRLFRWRWMTGRCFIQINSRMCDVVFQIVLGVFHV